MYVFLHVFLLHVFLHMFLDVLSSYMCSYYMYSLHVSLDVCACVEKNLLLLQKSWCLLAADVATSSWPGISGASVCAHAFMCAFDCVCLSVSSDTIHSSTRIDLNIYTAWHPDG